MNLRSLTAGVAASAATLFIPTALAGPGNGGNKADALPSMPVANFRVTPTVVQEGTQPTLSWGIVYPSRIGDVATITPPGMITLNQQMYVSVRPIGVGVTSSGGVETSAMPAEARISINGGSYQQLFYGTAADVDPSRSLYIKKLNPGTTIDFGGRYVQDARWSSFYTTRSSNMQVVSLVDGDTIPTSYELVQSDRLAEHLKPYVDSTGKVEIGPLSVLVLAEYGSDNPLSPAFDYQDFALLVNFSTKNNNGHGNNVDGVDSSNPGQGSGGPNGATDPSGGVDDE